MNNSIKIFAVFVSILVLIGCDKAPDKNSSAVEVESIVSVNGKCLTREMQNRRVEMMIQLQMICRPKSTAADLAKLRRQLEKSYVDLFVDDVILKDYMAANGIVIPEKVVERSRAGALRYCKAAKIKSWADLLEKLGDHAAEFEDQVAIEMRRTAVFEKWASDNPTNLPPNFASSEIERIKLHNTHMDMTNVIVYARATNVWQKLEAGADFGEMAAQWSEVKTERDDRGDWGALDWRQIESDPLLYKYAKSLEIGKFSPPIEADNTLMILRVDKRDEKECKMSRIVFLLPMYWKVPTEAEIVETLQKAHAKRICKSKFVELRKAAKIVRFDNKKQGENQ